MTHSVLSSLEGNFYCFIKSWAETFIFQWGHLHSVQFRYLYKVDAIWGKLGKCIGAEHILTDIIFLFKYIIFLPKFKLSNYENKSLILKTGMSLKLEINTIFKHQMALVLLVYLIFLFVFDLRYTSHCMYILLSWVNKPQFAMLTSWLFSISETISLSFLSRSYDLSFFLAGS